jgi:dienelactone hydrolase
MTRLPVNRRLCLRWGTAAAIAVAATAARAEPLRPASAAGGLLDVPALPDPLEWDWHDAARQRTVPVRLYLPHASLARGALPLVVFSHGIGGSRRGYSWLGRHFASQGMASLHLQHVGSDRQLWAGNVFHLVGRLQLAAQEAEALARVQDLRFALDTLLSGALAHRIDAGCIIAAGHSYGANTALLAAGARVRRPGQPAVPLADDRVCAAIIISAPPFYGYGDPSDILAGVQIPTLHVTATEDVIRIPGYFSGLEDRVAVFEATASPRKWLAVFEGGSHSMFTDRLGAGGLALNPRVKLATRELASAFARTVFEGDSRDMAVWPQRHQDILARHRGFEAAQAT